MLARSIWMVALVASAVFAVAQQEAMDAVHLKNGGVIFGTVLEFDPGGSLKIQTRDGSVFVYPMEDVERVVRERAAPREKSAGAALGWSLSVGLAMSGAGQWHNGDVDKGFAFASASMVGNAFIYAGLEDNVGSFDLDNDNDYVTLGAAIRLMTYIWSSVDAYRRAKRREPLPVARNGIRVAVDPGRDFRVAALLSRRM